MIGDSFFYFALFGFQVTLPQELQPFLTGG
jgi:hypothetical protein